MRPASRPSQWLAKHSLDRGTYFVYGRLFDDAWQAAARHPLAVVAFSSRYRRDEIVEINQLGQARSYYGMNLPGGDYRLAVFADVNRNGVFEAEEMVGERRLTLSARAPAISSTPIEVRGMSRAVPMASCRSRANWRREWSRRNPA